MCYIAHCYPYTFTDLKNDLDYLSSIRPANVFRREVLCETQAGNSCFIITVTNECKIRRTRKKTNFNAYLIFYCTTLLF